MSTPSYEEIKPAADDLLVFIDDTGHETFAGNQGFYGLGGCLTTGLAYELLKPKWRGVRQIINGDPEAPLHGSDVTANPKPESFVALRTFFEDRSFARIAVTTTKEVGLPVRRCIHSLRPCHWSALQRDRNCRRSCRLCAALRTHMDYFGKLGSRRSSCQALLWSTHLPKRSAGDSCRALPYAQERERAGARSR